MEKMSEYRSFGRNYHPSSQSRMISIGVMADSQPKRNPGPDKKGDGDVIARAEKLKSATVTELQANKKDKGVLAAKQRNAAKDTEHVTSPLRSLGSSYRKLGTLENVLCKQTSSLLSSKGLNKGLNGAAHQSFPVSNPQGSDGELNGSRNDKGMDRSPERMEEPPTAVLQQKVASQREEMDKPEKGKNGTTHALRSKLWEILGKASPENNEDVNSETPEVVKTNSKLSQDKGSNDDPLTKPRHNSDSIETDSESPENETRRPVTGKRSPLSDKKGSSHELDPQRKAQKQKPDISTREEDFHPSPEAENEFQSPTFGYKAAIASPSPCFSPEASPLHPRNISPALDETEAPIFSFGTKKTSQRTTGKASDTERRLPEFLEKKGGYSFRKDSSTKPNEDLVMSNPSSDEKSSDGSGDESPALGHYNSPEERETANWSNEKSKREFSSAKRNSNLKGNGFSSAKRNSNLKGNGRVVLSPTSSLSKGNDKTDISEMDEDVGLGRAVASFASALENFEKKLKSGAKKKSSEIIASVSEEIHVELENVKSHIITEAGKTINTAKTKRKHAETRLHEQQEKMRMIHEKFKEDIGHHLEDFKCTIEGLETDHSELKGALKKQKTSHQKLIAEFEGGIEKKLDSAAKRIDSVNKSARRKMMQLKMTMGKCLKDGVLD